MKVYNYNDNGEYVGANDADESPLEPGVFLIPANATTIEPPTVDTQHIAVYNGQSWDIKDISLDAEPPTEPTPIEQPKNQTEILQEQLDLMKKAMDDLIFNGGM